MNAEYTHNGKLRSFEVVTLDRDPPNHMTMSERTACGKKTIRFILKLNYIDTARDVAVYDVVSTKTELV